MPKLMPELKEQIRKTAETLFIKEGFMDVSMRMIAAELNIAVGTLYNYFPNKAALFQNIMHKSWEITFQKIENLTAEMNAPDIKTRQEALTIIYQGIKSRGGYAQKAFEIKYDRDKSHSISPVNNDAILERLEEVLKPLEAGFSGPHSKRLIITILSTIRFFIFPISSESEQEDIEYLSHITEVI